MIKKLKTFWRPVLPPLRGVRHAAIRESLRNKTITVYEWVDGAEVRRRAYESPFTRLAINLQKVTEAIQRMTFEPLAEKLQNMLGGSCSPHLVRFDEPRNDAQW